MGLVLTIAIVILIKSVAYELLCFFHPIKE